MNPYYKPNIREVLTDEGIVVTDGPNDEYVKTVPNDDRVTKLVREAIAIYESGDEDRFMEFVYDKELRKDWPLEETFMFQGARFTTNGRMADIDQLKTEIEIRRFKEEYPEG